MYSVPRSTPRTAEAANTWEARKKMAARSITSGDVLADLDTMVGGGGCAEGTSTYSQKREDGRIWINCWGKRKRGRGSRSHQRRGQRVSRGGRMSYGEMSPRGEAATIFESMGQERAMQREERLMWPQWECGSRIVGVEASTGGDGHGHRGRRGQPGRPVAVAATDC